MSLQERITMMYYDNHDVHKWISSTERSFARDVRSNVLNILYSRMVTPFVNNATSDKLMTVYASIV